MEELNRLEAKQPLEVKQTREWKRSYWFDRVSEFAKSGLTQRKFCELHGLKLHALRRWKNCFKKATEKVLKGSPEGVNFLSLELNDETKLGRKVYSDKIVFRHESGITLELEESSNKVLFRSGLMLLLELTRC